MPSLIEYFEKNRYKPKYYLGDRVSGHWNNIPFRGSVANDSLVSEEVGPEISIFLDLPIVYKNRVHSIIKTTHKNVKSASSPFKVKK